MRTVHYLPHTQRGIRCSAVVLVSGWWWGRLGGGGGEGGALLAVAIGDAWPWPWR